MYVLAATLPSGAAPMSVETLAPRPLPCFYEGGEALAELRGTSARRRHPEEWLGATIPRHDGSKASLAVLGSGRLLVDEISAAPEYWLGAAHVREFGGDPALLAKLLNTGERLPIHVHPSRNFAREHLGLPYGKTEGWAVISARPDAAIYLGWKQEVLREAIAGAVRAGNLAEFLPMMHRVPVGAGDWVFVPGGMPHSIGEDILLLELQEPTDLSLMLDRAGTGLSLREAMLDADVEDVIDDVEMRPVSEARLGELTGTSSAGELEGVTRLFSHEADDFFRADYLRGAFENEIGPGFAIVVILSGRGFLETGDRKLTVRRGDAIAVAHAAGSKRLVGEVEGICCQPPASSTCESSGNRR